MNESTTNVSLSKLSGCPTVSSNAVHFNDDDSHRQDDNESKMPKPINSYESNFPHIFESTFPHKLYHILQNRDFKDIIAWMPHGRSWKLLDRKEFTKRVLPLYFRHQKHASFKRQLSGWEFRRGLKECVGNEYYHQVSSQ
jgi:HSF-type DNA-binding